MRSNSKILHTLVYHSQARTSKNINRRQAAFIISDKHFLMETFVFLNFFVKSIYHFWVQDAVREAWMRPTPLSWPCCGPASLTLFLPTLFGKRGIFTCSTLPWVFCPLSFYITMMLISDHIIVTCLFILWTLIWDLS